MNNASRLTGARITADWRELERHYESFGWHQQANEIRQKRLRIAGLYLEARKARP